MGDVAMDIAPAEIAGDGEDHGGPEAIEKLQAMGIGCGHLGLYLTVMIVLDAQLG
jgi:hypothetical protein